MRGNSHVRFLGGSGAARLPCHPVNCRMKNQKHISLLLVTCFALALSSCRQEFSFGKTRESVYSNRYLGLSVSAPKGWHEELFEEFRSKTNASTLPIVTLLAAHEHPLDSDKDHPSLVLTAIRIGDKTLRMGLDRVTTGKEYLELEKNFIQTSKQEVAFQQEMGSKILGDISFDVISSEEEWQGSTLKKRWYATEKKGYILVFIISFVTEEQEAILQDSLKSIRLK